MSAISVSVGSKKSILLDTAGKFCEQDILIKNEAYEDFWDAYQQNGERTDYRGAFSGAGWANLFTPKYSMQPTLATSMFECSYIANIQAELENAGVTLDLSKATNAQQMFAQSCTTHLGVLDLSNCEYIHYLFYYARWLETVDEIILSEKVKMAIDAFEQCSALKNITFGGVITQSLTFAQSSQLTDASVQSIIDHLKDLTGSTAQTLTLHATVGAALTAEQKAAITAKNWTLVY
jgi:hypothetical protein